MAPVGQGDAALARQVGAGEGVPVGGDVFLAARDSIGAIAEKAVPEPVALAERTAKILATDYHAQMGPLANPRRIAAMTDLMQDAVARGATVAPAGERIGSPGNFFAPTVLTDVPLDARVFNDEPFGPVAAIRGFNTMDEAIAEANRLSFGLAGYAFTRSLKHAHLLAHELQVGMLYINQPATPSAEMPFGGVKDSGYGTEGGPEALDAYLNTRAVTVMNV